VIEWSVFSEKGKYDFCCVDARMNRSHTYIYTIHHLFYSNLTGSELPNNKSEKHSFDCCISISNRNQRSRD